MRMESYPFDGGRSVIKSIDMYWKGPSMTCRSKGCKGARVRHVRVLDSWHFAQPCTYSLTICMSLGPSYHRLRRSKVLAIPGYPPIGVSWISLRISRHLSMSLGRWILLTVRV